MPRGAPTFFSGSRETVIDGSQAANMVTDIVSELQTYTSNSTTAWETYDAINTTSGSWDVVYRSVGDRTLVSGAGDAHLLFRIEQVSNDDLRFSMYQDWSDVSSTGARQAGGSIAQWANVNVNSAYRYWGAVNEYEFCFLMKQSQRWYWLHFGGPNRVHVPSVSRGVAFTTAAATAGSAVTVNLDRDISGSIIDATDPNGPQNIWIHNVTPSGAALRSSDIDITTVDAITSTSITFNTLSNNFDSGAIVGLDPTPSFVFEVDSITSGGSIDQQVLFTNRVDGTWVNVNQQPADYESFMASLGTPSASPGPDRLLRGVKAAFLMDSSGALGYRGISDLVAFVFSGSLVDGDFWRPNFSTANQYMVFPSIGFGSGTSTPVLAIGPGAT